jgi:hypothetical protein
LQRAGAAKILRRKHRAAELRAARPGHATRHTMTAANLPASAPGPAAPPDAAWDEAFLRVESYLRAHHIESRQQLNRLATEIIAEARAAADKNPAPTEAPVTAALRVTHARIGAWFARAGLGADWSSERERARGRLALLLADVPGRWPAWFLHAVPPPPELARALASGRLQPGPGLRRSNMPPAPLEFGFDAAPRAARPRLRAWPWVRAAAPWLCLVGVYGLAWAASR